MSACIALAACDEEGHGDDEGDAEQHANAADELLADARPEGWRPPCGDALIADLETESGSRVRICELASGGFAVGETAPLGHARSDLVQQNRKCPREIWLNLSDEPLPPGLDNAACELDELGWEVPSAAASSASADGGLAAEPETQASHFCAADGDEEFDQERCEQMWIWAENSMDYGGSYFCHPGHWHMAQFDSPEPVEEMRAEQASCNGTTRMRMSLYWTHWVTQIDDDVLANYWADWWLVNVSPDAGMRYRGDRYSDNNDPFFRFTGFSGDLNTP